jgi:hypothetical protein
VAGELIVKLRPGVQRERGRALAREEGGVVVDEVGGLRLQRIRLPESRRAGAHAKLRRRAEVEWAIRNEVFTPSALPNDPSHADAWHLAKIGAPAAWDLSKGAGVTIAILDSGVDAAHPDLAAKLVPGWDFYENDATPNDANGHGTRVAGAAAAATNNAVGVAAVGWSAKLMPLRVAGPTGAASAWAVTQALAWGVDHGARVLNLSFGNVGDSLAVVDAAAHAVAQGAVVVVAAGNCACDETTPARPELLTVGATNELDVLGDFSSRGSHLDVVAPGLRIWTTDRNGAYGKYKGTSYSTPVASGVVALMLAANPELDAADVAALLEETAVDLGSSGWDPSFGHGRVDAFAAVQAAIEAAGPPPDTTAPSAAFTAPSAGDALAGTVTVRVSATDDTGVSAVELYVDGVFHGRDLVSPFRFAWDTTALPDGEHELRAVAFDAAGNGGETEPYVVTVQNADVTPPTLAITSPAAGTTIGTSVAITVQAADDRALASVEAFVDGVSLGVQTCAGTSCAPVFTWDALRAAGGWHVLSARAVDAVGHVGEAAPISVLRDRSSGGHRDGRRR